MGSLLRKRGEGWCQVNALGREVNSWTQPLRALWMGNKGVYSLGEGKASSSLSKHTLLHRGSLCLCGTAAQPLDSITVCLTSELLPGSRSPPAKAAQKRGGSPRVPIPATGPALRPICQPKDGPHLEQVCVAPSVLTCGQTPGFAQPGTVLSPCQVHPPATPS